MEALEARPELQQVLNMLNQLEPALDCDGQRRLSGRQSKGGGNDTPNTRDEDENVVADVKFGNQKRSVTHTISLDGAPTYKFGSQVMERQKNRAASNGALPAAQEVGAAPITPASEARNQSSEGLQESEKKSSLAAVEEGFGGMSRIGYEKDSKSSIFSDQEHRSPLERVLEIKLRQSKIKQGGFNNSNKQQFLLKQCTTTKQTNGKPHPTQTHTSPKTPLPRPDKKPATFIQPKLEQLVSTKLNPNDASIIENLKQRMLNYMLEEKADEKKYRAKTIKALEKEALNMLNRKKGIIEPERRNQSGGPYDRSRVSTSAAQSFLMYMDNYQNKKKRFKSVKNSIESVMNIETYNKQTLNDGYSYLQKNRNVLEAGFGMEGPTVGRQSIDDAMFYGPLSNQVTEKLRTQKMHKTKKLATFAQKNLDEEVLKQELHVEHRKYFSTLLQPADGQVEDNQMSVMRRDTFLTAIDVQSCKKPVSLNIQSHLNNRLTMQDPTNRELYKILKNLNFKNIDSKKQQMTNQLNQVVHRKNRKEDQLKQLYKELDTLTHLNLSQNISQIRAGELMREKQVGRHDPNKCFQNRTHETLMDVNSCKQQFNYSDMVSVLERKDTLLVKLETISDKQAEEDSLNQTYLKMINKLEEGNLYELQENQLVEAKVNNLELVVTNLSQINVQEANRKYQVDGLLNHYKKVIEKDQMAMEKVDEEKHILFQIQEEENKQVLLRMVNHLRDIKELKKGLSIIDEQKKQFKKKEKELVSAFQRRKEEIALLTQIALLKQIYNYSVKLDQVGDGQNDIGDDTIRQQGLELVETLKADLATVKKIPSFTRRLVSGNSEISRVQSSNARPGLGRNSGSFKIQQTPQLHRKSPTKALFQTSPNRTGATPSQELKIEAVESATSEMSFIMDESRVPPMTQLENYIIHKQAYDQFYEEYYAANMHVNIESVIQKYLKSNTKLKYLQNGFDSRERDKMNKTLELEKLEKLYTSLQNEKEIVGEYIKSLDIRQEHRLQDLCPIGYSDPVTDQTGTEGAYVSTRFPWSIGVMQIYLNGLIQKGFTLQQFRAETASVVSEFYYNFRYLIFGSVQKLNMIQNQAADSVVFTEQSAIQELLMKYIPNPDKKKDKLQLTSPEVRSPFKRSLVKEGSSLKKTSVRKQSGIIHQQDGLSLLQVNHQSESYTNNRDLQVVQSALDRTIETPGTGIFSGSVKKEDHQATSMTPTQFSLVTDVRILLSVLSQASTMDFSPKLRKRMKSSDKLSNVFEHQALNIADFDPIFRKREFATIQRQAQKMLKLGRTLNKQEQFHLRDKAQREREFMYTHYVDEDQVEFQTQPKSSNWLNLNDRGPKHQNNAVQFYQKKVEMKEVGSDDGLSNEEQQVLKIGAKSTIATLVQPKRTHAIEVKEQLNELYQQKHFAESVERNEVFFIEDLKEKIRNRHSTLQESFLNEYDSTMPKKDMAIHKLVLQCGRRNRKGNQSQQIPDGQRRQGSREHPNDISLYNSLSSKQNNPNYVQLANQQDPRHQRVFSAVQRSQQWPGRWLNFTALDESSALDFKPLKSACFDNGQSRAPPTASIKERIQINKSLTRNLNTKTQTSQNFRRKLRNSDLMKESSKPTTLASETAARSPLVRGPSTSQNLAQMGNQAQVQRMMTKARRTLSSRSPRSAAPRQAKPFTSGSYTSNQAFNIQYQTVTKQHERAAAFLQKQHEHYKSRDFVALRKNKRGRYPQAGSYNMGSGSLVDQDYE